MRSIGHRPSPPIVAAGVLLALGLHIGCDVEPPVPPAAPVAAVPAPAPPAPIDIAVAAQEALRPLPPPGTRWESQPRSFCVSGAGRPNRRVTATIEFGCNSSTQLDFTPGTCVIERRGETLEIVLARPSSKPQPWGAAGAQDCGGVPPVTCTSAPFPNGSYRVVLGDSALPTRVPSPISPATCSTPEGVVTRGVSPVVTSGKPMIRGNVDRTAVRRAVTAQLGWVQALCFRGASVREFLKVDAGTVTIRFSFGVDGRVREAAVVTDTLGDPEAATCVTRQLRNIKFPAPLGDGTVEVTWPFVIAFTR